MTTCTNCHQPMPAIYVKGVLWRVCGKCFPGVTSDEQLAREAEAQRKLKNWEVAQANGL